MPRLRATWAGKERWHARCRPLTMRETNATEVEHAELEVARSKRRLQESLHVAGETGSRLATEIRRKATPALIIAAVVGGAVVAGAAITMARSETRRRRSSASASSATGMLARAVGAWLLRAAALRFAEVLAAKLRDSTPPVLAGHAAPQ
jgi:hypothetical protein